MNHMQRHQFGALCEALYRKEREAVDHQRDEASNVMASAQTAEPGVTIGKSVARTALRLAEQAADEINAKLRDAEVGRDELARKLGAQQDMIDRLTSEREYRTRHVRALLASVEVGREQH